MKHLRQPLPEASLTSDADSEALMALINGIRHYDLRLYCIDQIRSAETADDVSAAVSLVREVARRRIC